MGWTDEEAADLAIPASRGPSKGLRPTPPFLMIRVDIFGQSIGTDETIYRQSGSYANRYREGQRRGLVNIQGFGFEAADWLERLAMNIDKAPDPLSIVNTGEIVDISEIEGTTFQARFSRDFNVSYGLVDGPETAVEAEAVDADLDAPLDIELNVDWS